jgi:hypothetical protein
MVAVVVAGIAPLAAQHLRVLLGEMEAALGGQETQEPVVAAVVLDSRLLLRVLHIPVVTVPMVAVVAVVVAALLAAPAVAASFSSTHKRPA